MNPSAADRPARGFVWAVALAASSFWLVDLLLLDGGAPHPLDDTWEYGLVARSLLAGQGFRTSMIHPPLWGLRDAALTVPVLVHGPVLPLLEVPVIALLGRTALDGTAWLAAAFAVLAAAFTARAVAHASGQLAGAVAAGLVTFSPTLLRMVHHDIAPAAGTCAVALVLDRVVRPRPVPFAAGVALGLGVLVRPELLIAAPFVAYALGASPALPFVLGAALAVAPWAAHNAAATGALGFNLSSYLLFAYTPAHPGLSPLQDFGIPPERWTAALVAALPWLPAKWLWLAPHAAKYALMIPGPGLALVSGLGLIAAARSPETRRYACAAAGAALVPVLVCTLTEPSERYAAVFIPLWAAGAVHAAQATAGAEARRRCASGALLVFLLPFTAGAMRDEARQSAALRRWLGAERAALASRAAPEWRGRLLFSDTPDFAAWTTGRPTVWTTLEAYRSLPEAPGAVPFLPVRGALDEWFHADVHALSPGGAAADATRDDRGGER